MGAPYNSMELASFMSCSKGYMGECGIRGGYAEVVNMEADVKAMLMKSISAKLCPTVIGQTCMDVVVNPPRPGEASYEEFAAQKSYILSSLADRAKLVADSFNSMEGFTCQVVQGGHVCFSTPSFAGKGRCKGQTNGSSTRCVLCIPTSGEHGYLHHTWLRVWSTTRHLSLPYDNFTAERCIGQYAGPY